MKTFIFALIILILLIGVVSLSGMFIQDAASAMISMTSDLPMSLDETLNNEEEKNIEDLKNAMYEINIYWHEKRNIIHLNVSQTEISKIDSAIARLSAACISGDNGEYATARAMLLDEIIDLKESEKISIKGIL